jgi:hypothetical protein
VKKKKSKYKVVKSLDGVVKELKAGKVLYWMSSLGFEEDEEIEDFACQYCWVETPDKTGKMSLVKEYHLSCWSEGFTIPWYRLTQGKWWTKGK